MIRKFCDRCGVDLTPKPKSIGEVIGSAFKDLSFSFSVRMKPEPVYKVIRDDDEEVHLCEKCQDAFKKFMKEGRPADDLSVKEIDEKMVKNSEK